ncbi:NYN domain-containing protein [Actinocorallia sp. API 0066]|uniref:NYN domain-containing protein n=1 Tax=Actinocorallia sp. API 0066 TaxID=2896846 RepID=UPI001E61A48E|nr:NYN domain-containing protein [Actinocorallia sp. API 0066]MCD0452972.1 NYN domain-containing protein [Actinocorallia sp. API 0066]
MDGVRAALYLDFDNVFSGLFKLDPRAALRFARDPGGWLGRLPSAAGGGRRRWLILRCYLNPGGSVPGHDAAGEPVRLYFSKFRAPFVRAGFEVVDCPPYNATKNGADIRIVIDALDALHSGTGYEEFVIASGDSDMAPLLQRLRRADRRTMVVSPANAAEGFTAIADLSLGSQQFLALLEDDIADYDDPDAAEAAEFETGPPLDGAASPDRRAAFRALVAAAYAEATGPLNLATLAHRARAELGDSAQVADWFGAGSFRRAVQSLDLPHLRISHNALWDESRHSAPAAPGAQAVALPEPVERLAEAQSLPRIPAAWWPQIYAALAEYAATRSFNLTECTSWTRDLLRERGYAVSRNVVGFVVHGTAWGGRSLAVSPPPNAAEIAAAFTTNILTQSTKLDTPLTDEETHILRTWLNPQEPPPP